MQGIGRLLREDRVKLINARGLIDHDEGHQQIQAKYNK